MSEKPKRPWFRFHLLTAVLIMLLSGLFLGLNLKRHPNPPFDETYQGWPLDYEHDWTYVYLSSKPTGYRKKLDTNYGGKYYLEQKEYPGWWKRPGYLYANIAFALVALIGTAFLSEYLIHRSEARKHDLQP